MSIEQQMIEQTKNEEPQTIAEQPVSTTLMTEPALTEPAIQKTAKVSKDSTRKYAMIGGAIVVVALTSMFLFRKATK